MVTVSGNSNPTNPTYHTNPTNPTNLTTINSGELTDKNRFKTAVVFTCKGWQLTIYWLSVSHNSHNSLCEIDRLVLKQRSSLVVPLYPQTTTTRLHLLTYLLHTKDETLSPINCIYLSDWMQHISLENSF